MPGLSDELIRFVTRPPKLTRRHGAPDVMQCEFFFTPDFAGFHGHFPDNPLLPGIVQIMLARYTAAQGRSALLSRVKRCKFSHPIGPGQTVLVQVRAGRAEKEYQAAISSNEIACATLTFELEHSEVWQ